MLSITNYLLSNQFINSQFSQIHFFLLKIIDDIEDLHILFLTSAIHFALLRHKTNSQSTKTGNEKWNQEHFLCVCLWYHESFSDSLCSVWSALKREYNPRLLEQLLVCSPIFFTAFYPIDFIITSLAREDTSKGQIIVM